MATIGSAKATLVNKIDTLTASATAKDTIYLAKALKENTTHHSFTFQGAWAATTAYALDDVVTTSGKTYICILAYTSGASFAVGSNWSLMAEKGTDGTDLTSTLTTAGDVVYKGASALTRLAKGTASQVLTMNSGATAPEWSDAAGGATGMDDVSGVARATSGLLFNGDTAAANVLDDYEEGTFTLAMHNGYNGTITNTYAQYTKIGRNVTVNFDGTINNAQNNSYVRILGFPFSVNASRIAVTAYYSYQQSVGLALGGGWFYYQTTTVGGNNQGQDSAWLDAATGITFQATYII